MASELKTISDTIKPVLSGLGYRRKGNTFYRISDGVAYCIAVEHPGLYFARFFILPLYTPIEFLYFTYGDRLKIYWDGNGDGTVFISQIIDGIYNIIIPFFQQIDSASQLLAFLQQDHSYVSPYFFCPGFEISRLAAHTALMLHNSEAFHRAVSKTRWQLSVTTSFARSVIEKIEAELTNLEKIELLPAAEIDQYFQSQTLQSLQKLFPKYKKQQSVQDTQNRGPSPVFPGEIFPL